MTTSTLGRVDSEDASKSMKHVNEAKRDHSAISEFVKEAFALNGNRKYKEAMCAISKALEIDPVSSEAIYCQIQVMRCLIDEAMAVYSRLMYKEALLKFRMALDVIPNHRGYKYQLIPCYVYAGECCRHLKIVDDGLTYYTKALKLDDKSVMALSGKAHLLGMLGNFEEASLAISRALELDPADTNTRDIKADLRKMETRALWMLRMREFQCLVAEKIMSISDHANAVIGKVKSIGDHLKDE